MLVGCNNLRLAYVSVSLLQESWPREPPLNYSCYVCLQVPVCTCVGPHIDAKWCKCEASYLPFYEGGVMTVRLAGRKYVHVNGI